MSTGKPQQLRNDKALAFDWRDRGFSDWAGAFHLLSAQPGLSILENQEPQETTHRTRADGDELIKTYMIVCSLEDAISSVEKDSGKKAHRLKS